MRHETNDITLKDETKLLQAAMEAKIKADELTRAKEDGQTRAKADVQTRVRLSMQEESHLEAAVIEIETQNCVEAGDEREAEAPAADGEGGGRGPIPLEVRQEGPAQDGPCRGTDGQDSNAMQAERDSAGMEATATLREDGEALGGAGLGAEQPTEAGP